MLSERAKRISPSASMQAAEQAKQEGVIDLTIGEPDFPTPQHIVEAAHKAIDDGKTKYTDSRGIIELRRAIADKLEVDNGLKYLSSEIIVTPGAKQAIFYALLAVVDEGDEVIVFDPYWVSYEPCISLAGGDMVAVKSVQQLESEVNALTKAIIINSPNNPAGYVFDRDALKVIADVARKNNLLVISDEIYEKIIYDGKHISIASLQGMRDRTIVVNGFSKAYAMTGFRIGYLATSETLASAILPIHQHSATCASSISQYAALAALEGEQVYVKAMVWEYKHRRDIMVEGFNSLGLYCDAPQGTFYALVDIMMLGMTSVDAANYFLDKAKVATVPGSAYGNAGEGYLRVSFATSMNNIEKAISNLGELLGYE